MRVWIYAAFLVIIARPPAAAGDKSPPEFLTLSAVVDMVLRRSPALSEARARVAQSAAGLAEARLSRFPRLSAKSAVTRSDDPVYAFSSLLDQRRFSAQDFAIDALNHPGYLTNVKSALELGFPLFTGFRLTEREKLSRFRLQQADSGESAVRQASRFNATDAYLQLLLARTESDVLRARIASAEAELNDARGLRGKGLVLGSDFYAAEAVLDGLKAWRIRLQSQISAGESTLGLLTGSSGAIVPLGSLKETEYALAAQYAWAEEALRDRPDLRQAGLGESAAQAMRRETDLSLLPQVEAFAALETDTRDFDSNAANRVVGLRLEMPIGDPTYFFRKEGAQARERAARAKRRSLEQAALIEVAQRYQEYEGWVGSLPVLKESVEKAEKSLELFKPLYREGRQSILEVLRAEEALAQAEAAYAQALCQAHIGYARLLWTAGRLDADEIQEIDRRLGDEKP